MAYLEAKVVNELDAGTHFVFLGEILETILPKRWRTMTYSYYRDIKRRVPHRCHYHEETRKRALSCQVCGYIYDSSFGDTNSVKPGTLFSDLLLSGCVPSVEQVRSV